MNWKKRFVIKLLLIVSIILLTPISLNAQTIGLLKYQETMDPEKEILRGEKAPYDGVLVPWPQFYHYNSELEKNLAAKVEPVDCGSCFKSMVSTGLVFLVIGVLSGMYLESNR